MLMIRFQRIGRKNDAAFRIVVTENTSGPKSGKHVDLVGSYNPKTKATSVNAESIKKWIGYGAQVSPSVHNLLIKEGVISGKKINVLPKKSPIVKESTEDTDGASSKTDTSAAEDTQKTDKAESPKEEVTQPSSEETPIFEKKVEEKKKEEQTVVA